MNPSPEPSPCKRKCLGLFTQRPRWGLSWRGWTVLLGLLAATVATVMLEIQPFLAKTAPVHSPYLVVEGWVHEYAIAAATADFKKDGYEKIFTTGGPVVGSAYVNDFNTSADVGADLLKKAGLPADRVQPVPAHAVGRDRTYTSALALRDWFQQHQVSIDAINVLTEDTHARRTQLLFQEAFGPRVAVGIIAVPDPDYDPHHWWRTSEGFRSVVNEGVAWLYARFLFYPTGQ
ncbi:MAG TPA: ElyC/SanA/YdcF family protein [Verrucomicrobiae bacterium]|nr:ElyC/SanA/YdcF family protein [Verrucomicrobiae bacterium]